MDEFSCIANYVNQMKKTYNILMAEAYQSTWLLDTIQLLSGMSYHAHLPAVDPVIVEQILNNDYAIC